ncbi:MAG: hypothetical protein JSU03_04830 [Bacteroidetes bacterium]|nr:hypothetical protein [Bacteroidota bacterium]
MKTKMIKVCIVLTMFITIQTGCNSLIAHFDQAAYTQIVSVESDALTLMDKATEDYSLHKSEAEEVAGKIQKAYLYDKNRPKNKITAEMWNLIIDPGGHLYGGFIARWKAEGKLNPTFIGEAKNKVQENFDRIAQLESKKIKP